MTLPTNLGVVSTLTSALRWGARALCSCLFLTVLLAPVASFALRPDIGQMTLLDELPWGGWLSVAYLLALGLLWWVLHLVWQRNLLGMAVMSLVLGAPLTIISAASSDTLWTWLNAQEVRASSEHPALVLSRYTTTSTFKGSRRTHTWVALSHPLQAGQRVVLPEHRVPAELQTAGTLVCLTMHTGGWGWRWLDRPRACTAKEVAGPADPALPNLGLRPLQPRLLDRITGSAGRRADGFFDAQDRAWWLSDAIYRPQLLRAQGDAGPVATSRCQLWGEVRLSGDTRSLVAWMNRSALGEPEPPLLPHWAQLGRNVWALTLDADGDCSERAALLQPGWVLDADMDHATQRLAVLGARRRSSATPAATPGSALDYQVTVYQLGSNGPPPVLSEHALHSQLPGGQFPREMRLRWQGPSLVVDQPGRVLPLWVIAAAGTPGTAGVAIGVQVATMATSAPPATPALPVVLSRLEPAAWQLAASARLAPIDLYLHPDYPGALLLHRVRGQWFHLAPMPLPPEPPDAGDHEGAAAARQTAEPFDFQSVQARLSADGRRLIACGRLAWLPTQRCVLLALPWPD